MTETMDKDSIQTNGNQYNLKKAWMALIVVVLGTFMGMLDTTIVNIAIPTIMGSTNGGFGISLDSVKWIATAYALTLAAVIPLTGFFQKALGTKKVFMFALAIFTIGSVLSGLAWNINALIGFRILQGIGGGIIAPLGMSMILDLFPEKKRGVAFGMWGVAAMAAPAIGPTFGGFLVDSLSWRSIFYINVPVGIIAFVLCIFLLTGVKFKKFEKFDILGYVTFLTSVVLFIFILGEWSTINWSQATYPILCAVAALSFVAFIFFESRSPNPIVKVKLFKSFIFSYSFIVFCVIVISLMGVSYSLPYFIQTVMGKSPMDAGIIMLPASAAMALFFIIGGKLYDKIGLKPVIIPGFILLAVSSLLLARSYTIGVAVGTIILLSCLLYVALALINMPIATYTLSTVSQEDNAAASSMFNIMKQVMTALGVTLVTNLITSKTTSEMQTLMVGVNPSDNTAVAGVKLNAVAHAMSYSAEITAVLIVIALVMSFFFRKIKKTEPEEEAVAQTGSFPETQS